MTTAEKIELIKSVAEGGGDLVGVDELPAILESGEKLYTYDGFEPSGQMHISQGIMRAINVNKMIQAGFTFRMWVADWFGYLNNKMGGDLEKIKTVGRYFIEIWRASGMDLDHTEFLWTSEAVKDPSYWETVMRVAKSITLKRAIRTTQIMGRNESDDLSAGMIFYPCMQVTDIFHVMKAQVTQLGLDQQKANILAREVGEELGYWKPVIVSHGMLQGLQKPVEKKPVPAGSTDRENVGKFICVAQKMKLRLMDSQIELLGNTLENETIELDFVDIVHGNVLRTVRMRLGDKVKYFDLDVELLPDGKLLVSENTPERMLSMKMSKSMPDSSIFMTDTPEQVSQKIRKAYCPDGVVDDNPILAYCKYIIFNAHFLKRKSLLENDQFVVKRPEKFGGDVVYSSYEELEKAFIAKELFSLDLKNAVVEYLNELIRPVREHFENNAEAKAILEKVQSYQVTR